MILDGKKFEYGMCPSCDHRRPVYEKDGLCYGCGGHAMRVKKELELTVILNKCPQCRYVDHSGSFTVRGARTICGHSDACEERKSKDEFVEEYPEYGERDIDEHWSHHWYHRCVGSNEIPIWCPLRHGASY